jgi:thioredoxin reductase
LIHQFLSPVINTRDDEYGGSLENRMRFLRRVYRAIRQKTGADFVVGARFSASTAPGSLTEEEVQVVVSAMIAEGLDFVDSAFGDYYQMDLMIGGMQFPTGYEVASAVKFMKDVAVPRIVTGRFRTLDEAEQVLSEGVADLVGMVRALIADPELIVKTRSGRAEEVRPCIACNQGCIGSILRGAHMACTVNAVIGHESTHSEHLLERVDQPKLILIVGGGPAGLEAARIAALKGHKVVLAEAASKLGGAINVGSRAANQTALADITLWLEREVYRLGVDVRLNTYVELADVEAELPDLTIVATGSIPRMDGVQVGSPGEPASGIDKPHVLSSTDLIMGPRRDHGSSAVVVDNVGHFEAVVAAIHLIRQGVSVTFVTHHAGFAPYVQTTLRDYWALEQLNRGDFTLLVRHHLIEVKASSCIVRPLQGKNHREIPAQTVVLVTPNEPLRSLHDELKLAGRKSVLIGDALSPRDLLVAIAEGNRAAREIDNCLGLPS